MKKAPTILQVYIVLFIHMLLYKKNEIEIETKLRKMYDNAQKFPYLDLWFTSELFAVQWSRAKR